MKYKRILRVIFAIIVIGVAVTIFLSFIQMRADEGKVSAYVKNYLRDYQSRHGVYPADLSGFPQFMRNDPFTMSVIEQRKPRLENVKQSDGRFEGDLRYTAWLGSDYHIVLEQL